MVGERRASDTEDLIKRLIRLIISAVWHEAELTFRIHSALKAGAVLALRQAGHSLMTFAKLRR